MLIDLFSDFARRIFRHARSNDVAIEITRAHETEKQIPDLLPQNAGYIDMESVLPSEGYEELGCLLRVKSIAHE